MSLSRTALAPSLWLREDYRRSIREGGRSQRVRRCSGRHSDVTDIAYEPTASMLTYTRPVEIALSPLIKDEEGTRRDYCQLRIVRRKAVIFFIGVADTMSIIHQITPFPSWGKKFKLNSVSH